MVLRGRVPPGGHVSVSWRTWPCDGPYLPLGAWVCSGDGDALSISLWATRLIRFVLFLSGMCLGAHLSLSSHQGDPENFQPTDTLAAISKLPPPETQIF